MLLENVHPNSKSIMVSVVGAPNVGKSSMINYLLGHDLSVVTSKPQTTRNKFHCVFNVDYTEIVLIDTPGLHKSGHELNKRINQQAKEGIDGADLNLLLIDITKNPLEQIQAYQENIGVEISETWLIFTKSDRVENVENLPLDEIYEQGQKIIPATSRYFTISSKTGKDLHLLTGALCDRAIPGPPHYPKGDVSNKNQRFFATEYIREQAFKLLKDEIPYEVAVVIDEYRDMEDKRTDTLSSHISASILVNRPSQRAIVVGSKGSIIKAIGIGARKKIEAMTGGKVHLNLHVKVSPRWYKNNFVLEEIGLPRAKDSARVWRK